MKTFIYYVGEDDESIYLVFAESRASANKRAALEIDAEDFEERTTCVEYDTPEEACFVIRA